MSESDDLEYPKRSPKNSVRLTRAREFRAWQGKSRDLVRIESEAEEALRKAFDEARSEIVAKDKYYRGAIVKSFALIVTVRGAGGRIVRTGNIESILAEMSSREIELITLENDPSHWLESHAKLKIVFNRGHPLTWNPGAQIEVTGSDKQWVGGTFDRLASEMEKGSPWWSGAARTATDSVLGGVLSLAASQWLRTLVEPQYWITPLAVVLGVGLGIAIMTSLRKWVLVTFELLDAGEKPRSNRFILATLAVISFLASVVALVDWLTP